VVTNPFTVIQGPCSWSPPLCWLVLWNWVLEPSIDIHNIHICNFRLRVFTFLLVLFDSLAGKAFLARSIKLCLVDNQWSSGVMVVGFESCLIWSQIVNVEISTNRTYRLPLGRSGLYSSITYISLHYLYWVVIPSDDARDACWYYLVSLLEWY
jgi:hypothetical protein